MDFFAHQDRARRRTGLLLFFYILAVALIILAIYAGFVAIFAGAGRDDAQAKTGLSAWWHPELFMWVAGCTTAVVLIGAVYRVVQLGQGGAAVARLLGGRPINPNTDDLNERRILNVVEEMAIASGISVPPVYLLDSERGINAFAAGFTPRDAVIGVTRGCIEMLTRDELQGVVSHEFSHILNGDMRLNIRLIGVLNGILAISLIGHALLRAASRPATASRGRRGSNGAPIALFGLILVIIGYIGVFFGKLIKSAVSRQREFLADASAVQFTRNPSGIAGALKKIGGLTSGSRLVTARAEEASHMFFANGLAAESIAALMATHPPLRERIRRIDPTFDGVFPKIASRPAAADKQVETGLAGVLAASYAVSPNEVVGRVGNPGPAHLEYAESLIAGLPPRLVTETHEPFGATVLVYCLLMSRDAATRQAQLGYLASTVERPVLQHVQKLLPLTDARLVQERLPLVELVIPALKLLSTTQYDAFRRDVDALIAMDRHVDLFEYALLRMLHRHLEPAFKAVKKPVTQYYDIRPMLPTCAALLSALAHWGAESPEQADAAFRQAAAQLVPPGGLRILPADSCELSEVDRALETLATASPAIKKRVLSACVLCVGADGVVTAEEAELLRAIADGLDCPIPPFLPSAGTDSREAAA